MRVRLILCAILGSQALPLSLTAQQDSVPVLQGRAMGASYDRFIYEGDDLSAFSFRYSGLTPAGLGPEIGIALFPQALPAAALILAPDIGVAYNLAVPRATLLLKAGGSGIVGVGRWLAAFRPGFHLGGGLVVRLDHRTGMRVDIVRHVYFVDGEADPIWSIGIGFTVLPGTRRCPCTGSTR